MAIYQIGGQSIHSDDPGLPELLARIYSSRERPLCAIFWAVGSIFRLLQNV